MNGTIEGSNYHKLTFFVLFSFHRMGRCGAPKGETDGTVLSNAVLPVINDLP